MVTPIYKQYTGLYYYICDVKECVATDIVSLQSYLNNNNVRYDKTYWYDNKTFYCQYEISDIYTALIFEKKGSIPECYDNDLCYSGDSISFKDYLSYINDKVIKEIERKNKEYNSSTKWIRKVYLNEIEGILPLEYWITKEEQYKEFIVKNEEQDRKNLLSIKNSIETLMNSKDYDDGWE